MIEAHRVLAREAVVEASRSSPPDSLAGRGIVLVAGGPYWPGAYLVLRQLRALGCNWPAQLWHLGSAEMTALDVQIAGDLNCKCVDALEVNHRRPYRHQLTGWTAKPLAILESPFAEVLYLDADCYPVRHPGFLFEDPDYKRKGAIFWPDSQAERLTRHAWEVFALPYQDEPAFESGQIVLNKTLWWAALQVTWHLNSHSDFYYKWAGHQDARRVLYGDKDTFHMAAWLCNQPYVLWERFRSTATCYLHGDRNGELTFVHRCRNKFTVPGAKAFGSTPQPVQTQVEASLPYEAQLWSYLVELQALRRTAEQKRDSWRPPWPVVLCVPTLNRSDLLATLLASARAGTLVPDRVVVLDNGGSLTELDGVEVIRPGRNLGVAASWNRFLELATGGGGDQPVIISNDDVVLLPGTLEKLCLEAEAYPESLLICGRARGDEAGLFGMSFFLVRAGQALQQVGRFDEEFWPCLGPETRVLRDDLRWERIDQLNVGDGLVGVDEQPIGKRASRSYRHTTVAAIRKLRAPCLRLTLADGRTVVCSHNHRWLVQPALGHNLTWRRAVTLSPGCRICAPLSTWEEAHDYDAGWLAGIYDGEGCLHTGSRMHGLAFAQKEGPVLQRALAILTRLGVPYNVYRRTADDVVSVEINRRKEMLRLLGMIRPLRLLQRRCWEGIRVRSRTHKPGLAILQIEDVGERDVVDLTTTTGTFLAEGMVSHNSYYEDNDYIRRLLLAGRPLRSSQDVEFIHLHSATSARLTSTEFWTHQHHYQHCQAYYLRKWGGPPRRETYATPFNRPIPESRPEVILPPVAFPVACRSWAAGHPSAPQIPERGSITPVGEDSTDDGALLVGGVRLTTREEERARQDSIYLQKNRQQLDQLRAVLCGRSWQQPRLLEIGCLDGGSTVLWHEWLRPSRHLIVDSAPPPEEGLFAGYLSSHPATLRTAFGIDAGEPGLLADLLARHFPEGLDLVLDDASHLYAPTCATLEASFPHLQSGGLYLIEDWAWGHWDWPEELSSAWPGPELTKLVFSLIELCGTATEDGLVRSVLVQPHFVLVERGPALWPDGVRLEDLIRRRKSCKYWWPE